MLGLHVVSKTDARLTSDFRLDISRLKDSVYTITLWEKKVDPRYPYSFYCKENKLPYSSVDLKKTVEKCYYEGYRFRYEGVVRVKTKRVNDGTPSYYRSGRRMLRRNNNERTWYTLSLSQSDGFRLSDSLIEQRHRTPQEQIAYLRKHYGTITFRDGKIAFPQAKSASFRVGKK